ncbi:hypothetical protein GTP45_01010 [Pseudoduganella sp. FT55W]|uniref:Uncharacterized protein n=1 Tax=Duganella rivi TaxID=2666083 RepID=A0A7X4GKZ4_9BURK|nr:hypothetical protein [Duganella rivi]MYM65411.1 hypothetical protein [Duganella rivi]
MKNAITRRLIAESNAQTAKAHRAIAKADKTLASTKGMFSAPVADKPAPALTKAEQEKASFNAFVGKHLTKYAPKGAAHVR